LGQLPNSNIGYYIQYYQKFNNISEFQRKFREVVGKVKYEWDIVFYATHGKSFQVNENDYSFVYLTTDNGVNHVNLKNDITIDVKDKGLFLSLDVREAILNEIAKGNINGKVYFIACYLPNTNIPRNGLLSASDLFMSYKIYSPELNFEVEDNCLKSISLETARLELFHSIDNGLSFSKYDEDKNYFMVIDKEVLVQENIFKITEEKMRKNAEQIGH